MPKLLDADMQNLKTGSGYGFSAVNVDELGAPEYTLVTIVVDISSSVSAFEKELTNCLKTSLEACKKSPRSENLMLRLVAFNQDVSELHGFRLLNSIDSKEYDTILDVGGWTALYDGANSAIEATNDYAKILFDQDYLTNAIIFIITDGDDNRSHVTPKNVHDNIKKSIKAEHLESCTVVLIGVNTKTAGISDYLQNFQKEAEITQYIDIETADAKSLAKLAKFVSQSISSTSKALGSGAASQLLTF